MFNYLCQLLSNVLPCLCKHTLQQELLKHYLLANDRNSLSLSLSLSHTHRHTHTHTHTHAHTHTHTHCRWRCWQRDQWWTSSSLSWMAWCTVRIQYLLQKGGKGHAPYTSAYSSNSISKSLQTVPAQTASSRTNTCIQYTIYNTQYVY